MEFLSGYEFRQSQLLKQALTHKSFANENPDRASGDNEVLEFLGDAVLDLSLAELLIANYPHLDEGELSKVRASLVNENFLANLGREWGLEAHLLLGKGEKMSGGAAKPRLLASTLEAVFGALFQDAGFDRANQIIQSLFRAQLEKLDIQNHIQSDYKTRFQEKIQREHRVTPDYQLVSEEGPDHDKIFHVQVRVQDRVVSAGSGRSKKQAEQEAARLALEVNL